MSVIGMDNLRVSAHVPVSGEQETERGSSGWAADETWLCQCGRGSRLIFDEITGQTKGEINITAVSVVRGQNRPSGRFLEAGIVRFRKHT